MHPDDPPSPPRELPREPAASSPTRAARSPLSHSPPTAFTPFGDLALPLELTNAQHLSLNTVPHMPLPETPPSTRPPRPASAAAASSDDRVRTLHSHSDHSPPMDPAPFSPEFTGQQPSHAPRPSLQPLATATGSEQLDSGACSPGTIIGVAGILARRQLDHASTSRPLLASPWSSASDSGLHSVHEASWTAPSMVAVLPTEEAGFLPQSPSQPPSSTASSSPAATRDRDAFDWGTFTHAYGLGRWDPNRAPARPRSTVLSNTAAGMGAGTGPAAGLPSSFSVNPLATTTVSYTQTSLSEVNSPYIGLADPPRLDTAQLHRSLFSDAGGQLPPPPPPFPDPPAGDGTTSAPPRDPPSLALHTVVPPSGLALPSLADPASADTSSGSSGAASVGSYASGVSTAPTSRSNESLVHRSQSLELGAAAETTATMAVAAAELPKAAPARPGWATWDEVLSETDAREDAEANAQGVDRPSMASALPPVPIPPLLPPPAPEPPSHPPPAPPAPAPTHPPSLPPHAPHPALPTPSVAIQSATPPPPTHPVPFHLHTYTPRVVHRSEPTTSLRKRRLDVHSPSLNLPQDRIPSSSIVARRPGTADAPSTGITTRSTASANPPSPGPIPPLHPFDFMSAASMSSPMLSPEIATAAATMRLAGSGVSLAPLALPSPEHELTDPMRGIAIARHVSSEFGEDLTSLSPPDEGGSEGSGSGGGSYEGHGHGYGYGYGSSSGSTPTSATRRTFGETFAMASGSGTGGRGHYPSARMSPHISPYWDPSTDEYQPDSLAPGRYGGGGHMGMGMGLRSPLSTIESEPGSSAPSEMPSAVTSPSPNPPASISASSPSPGLLMDAKGKGRAVSGSGSGSGSSEGSGRSGSTRKSSGGILPSQLPPPASAPVMWTDREHGAIGDYFSIVEKAKRHRDVPADPPTAASLYGDEATSKLPSPVPPLSSSHAWQHVQHYAPPSPTAKLKRRESTPAAPILGTSQGQYARETRHGRPSTASSTTTNYQSTPFIPRSSAPLRTTTSAPTSSAKKAMLMRQTSSPLPNTLSPEETGGGGSSSTGSSTAGASSAAPTATPGSNGGSGSGGSGSGTDAAASAPSSLGRTSRLTQTESAYTTLGYLAPPMPPDEMQRRRALYKYNIMHTGSDANFDRIAHLAKLVFSAKVVLLSLVDSEEVWFKSQSGFPSNSAARHETFCAHTILQRSDEPIILNDATQDWRFANNPFVIGPPYTRFYAGANLRTADGYNVGVLCIMDDKPRSDFSPRQRHTLKEFAAIVMREMELWRDKIQLRIRDRIQLSMEQFTRECIEIDSETTPGQEGSHSLLAGSSMDKVYGRAAKLVKRTLDVEGAVVMDVSHVDVTETMNAEGHVSLVLHYANAQHQPTRGSHLLQADDYTRFLDFFSRFPDGKIAEGIMPTAFRAFLPIHVQYALIVPIFNIDKRPFALLCAYNTSDYNKPYLEGHELSYLRAIGVIILSAVLKRRMILADKAKSLFISNISHELRTPLHGILAAAELLSESSLDHNQQSFLQTVQACGTSLVETVNHVLDFTKLSGNGKGGGAESVILPNRVNLMHLVEEAVEGCWIGHHARMSSFMNSEIGSVYAPPSQTATTTNHVETVVDIDHRSSGWNLRCERGGIRRVLMNLLGNSLKFTLNGSIRIVLREVQPAQPTPDKVRIELAVLDTGKGISDNFLKNQLFHPFSQENPMQSGTGLGLAIVNSIVRSDSIDGKVDVWSVEGTGTEIRVFFDADITDNGEPDDNIESWRQDDSHPVTVSLLNFDEHVRGVNLLRETVVKDLSSWWNLSIAADDSGDIVIINEDPAPVIEATDRRDCSRPFIVLSSNRGDARLLQVVSNFERLGGFCRVIFKPGGPSRLGAVLKLCVHMLHISDVSQLQSPKRLPLEIQEEDQLSALTQSQLRVEGITPPLSRRRSDEGAPSVLKISRPAMHPRSVTSHALPSNWIEPKATSQRIASPERASPSSSGLAPDSPTFTVGSGGTMLRSAVGTVQAESGIRVLVVEDNAILRNLLMRWLTSTGYAHMGASNGLDGVRAFEAEGRFDIVLLDMSMPLLDGVGAARRIRQVEATRRTATHPAAPDPPTRILALTGMSSLDDKRKAFEAGVDGYLVKPVAFKTLEAMFRQLSTS